MNEQILVTSRSILFQDYVFQGFLPASEYNFEQLILQNHEYINRDHAEQDLSYQQPIPYALIFDQQNRVFTYQRGKKGTESRLHAKWSCGIGGHIDLIDQQLDNPIHASLIREIEEELGIDSIEHLELLGYINDDSTPVSSVHFGLLYKITLKGNAEITLAPEIVNGSFQFVQDIQSSLEQYEEWSQFALKQIK